MSPDLDNLETPAKAFIRKMPPPGQVVIDKQTREEYDDRYGVYYFQNFTIRSKHTDIRDLIRN